MHIGWGDYLSRARRDFWRLLIRAAPFSIFGDLKMNKDNKFGLTPCLRGFLAADAMTNHQLLGWRLPISILQRNEHSCTIRIFPEDGYNFFMGCEVARIYNLASLFELSCLVIVRDSKTYVEVSDYF